MIIHKTTDVYMSLTSYIRRELNPHIDVDDYGRLLHVEKGKKYLGIFPNTIIERIGEIYFDHDEDEYVIQLDQNEYEDVIINVANDYSKITNKNIVIEKINYPVI
jgi:hypothetical protein